MSKDAPASTAAAAAATPGTGAGTAAALADSKDDNTRGIPAAVFIEKVEEYVKPRGGPDAVLKELHNLYGYGARTPSVSIAFETDRTRARLMDVMCDAIAGPPPLPL